MRWLKADSDLEVGEGLLRTCGHLTGATLAAEPAARP
jgi:hypothetical protein